MQASVAHAAEVVIDFETASTSSSYEMISSGYAGLSWGSNVWVISNRALPGTGYAYGTIDSYSSFHGSCLPWKLVYPDTVDVDGAYITNAWTASSSVQVDGCNEADESDADGDECDASDYGGDDCDDANSSVYPGTEEP